MLDAAAGQTSVDVRPILERRADNIWAQAAKVRDRLYDSLVQTCNRESVEALVLKSGPFIHPAWVKFECWIPERERSITERASAVISIEAKPFHRFEFEYHLEMEDRGRKKTTRALREFKDQDVSALVLFLLRRGPKPDYRPEQLRQKAWELWKLKNKIKAIETDWLGLIPGLLFLLGPFLLLLGISWEEGLTLVVGLLVFSAAFVLARYVVRRPRRVRSSGKPEGEPRFLTRIDSWQTVIFGAGIDYQTVRERLLKALANAPTEHYRLSIERIWYWGLEGKEEREQIVLTLKRGILFCQIYPYGRELYVGWDAHLNRGQWVERTVASGIDADTGQLISINTVQPGTQQVTEYDVHDVSCLIEWTHAQLVKLLKQFMEERKIDQEIDFKIQRGERQHLTSPGKAAETGEGKPQNVVRRVTKDVLTSFRRAG